jgi:hypothetical protein
MSDLWSEDRGALLTLTAAALAGFSALPNGGHNRPGESDEEIGRKAAARARAAIAALDEQATAPGARGPGPAKAKR